MSGKDFYLNFELPKEYKPSPHIITEAPVGMDIFPEFYEFNDIGKTYKHRKATLILMKIEEAKRSHPNEKEFIQELIDKYNSIMKEIN